MPPTDVSTGIDVSTDVSTGTGPGPHRAGGAEDTLDLRLTESRTFNSGVVYLRHQRHALSLAPACPHVDGLTVSNRGPDRQSRSGRRSASRARPPGEFGSAHAAFGLIRPSTGATPTDRSWR